MESKEYFELVNAGVAPEIIAKLAKAQAEAELAYFEQTGKYRSESVAKSEHLGIVRE